jgi:hypothetical protein
MTTRLIVSWLICQGLVTASIARPMLVAVDLPDHASIKRWCELGHPTFMHWENTAIAEMDESELLVLAQEGFTPRVIDTSAWNQTYAMCFREQTRKPDLPGTVLWQKGNLSLCEVTDATLNTLRRRGFEFQLMEKTPLPDRFWEGLMVKHIPLRSLEWDP